MTTNSPAAVSEFLSFPGQSSYKTATIIINNDHSRHPESTNSFGVLRVLKKYIKSVGMVAEGRVIRLVPNGPNRPAWPDDGSEAAVLYTVNLTDREQYVFVIHS